VCVSGCLNGCINNVSPCILCAASDFWFRRFRSDTTITNLRFPFLENEDGSSLTGEAQIELFYNNFIQPLADTFRYEIYINDRAFQKSNTIVTEEMIVSN
jgi:hypothetical protein